MPGISELVVDELTAGLRPATPDNLPAIGPGSLRWACLGGRAYRRGDPAGAVTAQIVVAGSMGGPTPLAGCRVLARSVRGAAVGT